MTEHPTEAWNDDGSQFVDRALRQLEAAWRVGPNPNLRDFVPAHDHPLRLRTLVTLIPTDQEHRWRRGDRKLVEAYLDEWPQLRDSPAESVELVHSEMRTRRALGESFDSDEYRVRFPNFPVSSASSPVVEDEDTPWVLRPGQMFGDRFYIVRRIGRGGMGEVYLARDNKLEREVALKTPRRELLGDQVMMKRFVQEAKTAAKIEHDHICPIYDVGSIDGVPFIVMRLLTGQSLAERIRNGDFAPARCEQAADVLVKTAAAVQRLHEAGIVHRDIKPQNVMFNEAGQPLLMDFGLAKSSAPTALAGLPQTTSGGLVGTIPYMAPEQLIESPADQLTDVYSLGVVLYETLTGGRPFDGPVLQMMKKIEQGNPARPSTLQKDIDGRLEEICLKAMAKERTQRFQSASQFAEELRRYLTPAPVVQKPRNRVAAWLMSVGAVAVLLATVIFFQTGRGQVEIAVPTPVQEIRIDSEFMEVKTEDATYEVRVGQHDVEVTYRDGLQEKKTFRVRWRGDKVRVDLGPRLSHVIRADGTGDDQANGIAVDRNSNAFVAGYTQSADLPATGGSHYLANNDAFVGKVDRAGRFEWLFYLGGGANDHAAAVATDQDGNAYVVGWTRSADFGRPGLQAYLGQDENAFVAKVKPKGELAWTRVFGGSNYDKAHAVAVDASGSILVAGLTASADFTATIRPEAKRRGAEDAFVVKLTAAGETEWIELLGGTAADAGFAVAADVAGNVLVAGETASPDFLTLGAEGAAYAGGDTDGFVAKFSPSGKLLWCRFVGGKGADAVGAMAVADGFDAVLTGRTDSPEVPQGLSKQEKGDLRSGVSAGSETRAEPGKAGAPAEPGEARAETSGGQDVLVARVSTLGRVEWSGRMGGSDLDEGKTIAVDAAGHALIGGETRSKDFPATASFGPPSQSTGNGFLVKLDVAGQTIWSALIGGSGLDVVNALAIDAQGNCRLAGWTDSADFRAAPPAAGERPGAGHAAFLAELTGVAQSRAPRRVGSRLPVAWSRTLSEQRDNTVCHVQLTPDGRHLVVFHYTDSAIAQVEKLDVDKGEIIWKKQADLRGKVVIQDQKVPHRVSITGWVDRGGCLYLTSGWAGHTLWKFDSELKQELWHYTAPFREGLEYVMNGVTDDAGNVYAGGYDGSWYPDGSTCVKLDKSGKLLWASRQCFGTGGDCYSTSLALDSKGNLYRVGRDDFVRDSMRQRGRLLGHDSESGDLILNKQLEPNTWIQGVFVDVEDNLYIACRLGVYAQADKLSDKCRTVVQKLDRKGRIIWERALPAEGIAPNPKGLLRRDDESFYVGFQQLCEGIWLSGFAEMTYDGQLRWMGLIDRPGWETGNCGFDARDGVIYVGLTNSADRNQSQVVALKP